MNNVLKLFKQELKYYYQISTKKLRRIRDLNHYFDLQLKLIYTY